MNNEDIPLPSDDVTPKHKQIIEVVKEEYGKARGSPSFITFMFYGGIIFLIGFIPVTLGVNLVYELGRALQTWGLSTGLNIISLAVLMILIIGVFGIFFIFVGLINANMMRIFWDIRLEEDLKPICCQGSSVNFLFCTWISILFLVLGPLLPYVGFFSIIYVVVTLSLLLIGSALIGRLVALRFVDESVIYIDKEVEDTTAVEDGLD